MENAWNEYLKLEKDVSQLKKALQEQMSSSLVSQVSPFPDTASTWRMFLSELQVIIT